MNRSGYYSGKKMEVEIPRITSRNFKSYYPQEFLENYLGDQRIATLQLRLSHESLVDVCLVYACQITCSIMYHSNKTYVRQNYHSIMDKMAMIFQSNKSEDVKRETVTGLVRIGEIVRLNSSHNAENFYKFLINGMSNSTSGTYYILALNETLKVRNMDEKQLNGMIEDIKVELEKTESSSKTVDLVELLRTVSIYETKVFVYNFVDIIDILVGCLIDHNKSTLLSYTITKTFIQWSSYWDMNVAFSISLLQSFTEDLEELTEDIVNAQSEQSSQKYMKNIINLLQIFNTILSCIHVINGVVCSNLDAWIDIIYKCLESTLSKYFNETLLICGQRTFLILLKEEGTFKAKYETQIFRLIQAFTLHNFDGLTFRGKDFSLKFIGKVFKYSNSSQQATIVKSVLNVESLVHVIFSLDKQLKMSFINFFSILLNSKSVLLIQDIYSYLVNFLHQSLNDSNPKYSYRQGNTLILHILGSFCNLISSNGSVISKWALDPPIFTVLCAENKVADPSFIMREPMRHLILLRALHAHCHLKDNFIRTSCINAVLVAPSFSSTFYGKILEILRKLFDYNYGTRYLYLRISTWIERTFNTHPEVYTTNSTLFSSLIDSVLRFVYNHHNPKIIRKCLKPLISLINSNACTQEQIDYAYKIICIHISNKDEQIRELCHVLHSKIIPSTTCSNSIELHKDKLIKNLFLSRFMGQVNHIDFRHLIQHLFKTVNDDNKSFNNNRVLRRNFTDSNKGKDTFIKESALYNEELYNFWNACEISWFAIANKLKTPLGKAQDLLTTIEKQIRLQVQSPNVSLSHSLLGFFDIFERMLINSCRGGSAFHCKIPSKTASSFFSANEKTCTDWIKRLRPSLVALASKVNAYDFVIRQCNEALSLEYSSDNISDQENMLIHFSIALFKKGLSYDLKGLYSWCKKNTKIDGRWILALTDLTNYKIESLTKLLKNHKNIDPMIQQVIHDEVSFGQYQNQIKNYYSQTEGTYVGSQESWESLCQSFDKYTLTPQEDPLALTKSNSEPRLLIVQAHNKLIEAARIYMEHSHFDIDYCNKLSDVKTSIKKLCQMNLHSRFDCEMLILLKLVLREFNPGSDFELSFLHDIYKWEDSLSLKILVALKDWADLFIRRNGRYPPNIIEKAESLTFKIVNRSRDAQNFPLALEYLDSLLGNGSHDVLEYARCFNFSESFISIKQVRCFQEVAILADSLDKKELSCNLLTGTIMNILKSQSNENFEVSKLVADLMHDLAIFKKISLKDGETVSGQYSISDILILGNHFISSSVCELIPYNSVNPNCMEIGFLLKNSVSLSPDVAKYWGSFADWAFELGEQILQNEVTSSIKDSEKEALNNFDLAQDVFDKICSLFSNPKLQTKLAKDMTKLEFMEDQVKELCGDDISNLQNILEIWLTIQKRMYFYFELSLFSYFQQISLSTCEDKVIPATLRILHMIVKYSLELEEPLEKGLSVTPCRQWIPIIPQLFSRLNHPIKLVRNKLIELLSRLAKENAQSIIYPAIVGSLTKGKLSNIVDLQEDEDGSPKKNENSDKSMQSAYIQIVNNVRAECSMYEVDEIVALVFELQRISLLWDELWSATLQQYSNDINQRAKKLEKEIVKLRQNDALQGKEIKRLIFEKFNIIFKPLLFVLEKIVKITSVPETQNEINFSKKYQEHINNLIDSLRNPTDPFTPVNLLKQLQGKLSNKLYRHHCLSLRELSSVLANFKNVKIPMPGVVSHKNVTINSFHRILTTLATKTKPKKLWILGSDGKRYGYLLKGLEDLHLDERIMQFLTITNDMTNHNGYKARTYAVVPLGIRSGLIQWVKKAIPVFSLYKKWQQKKLNSNDEKQKNNLQNPSDLYYSKLFPLLREKGINNLDSRKKWPDSVLRDVMESLISETPNDLIASEIYFASYSSKDWYHKINNLTKSIAIMSTIGYIIGLGDRHLDNLLIDFAAGEIIHIDYNVCFEKGKNLIIPERVPCRLTQNIVKIFGVPGVQGAFKYSCEDVLKSLRGGCDTLINLLEAFVYDPLVDWTPGVDTLLAQNVNDLKHKKDLQTEIMFSMYCVRITEIESAWFDNKYSFIDYLSKMENSLDQWLETDGNQKTLNQDLSDMHVCMSLLKDAESNPRHKLFFSKSNYKEFRDSKQFEALVVEKIENMLADIENQYNLIKRTYSVMCPSQLEKWNNGLNFSLSSSIISNTLEKYVSMKQNIFNKLNKMEENYISSITHCKEELLEAVGLLSNYIQILSPLYSSTKKSHILITALDILNKLSNDLTIDNCIKSRNILSDLYHFNQENVDKVQRVIDALNNSWLNAAKTMIHIELDTNNYDNLIKDFKNDPLYRSEIIYNSLVRFISGTMKIMNDFKNEDDLTHLDEIIVRHNVLCNVDQIGVDISSLGDIGAIKNTKLLLNSINTFKSTTLLSIFFEQCHIFLKDRHAIIDLHKEVESILQESKLETLLDRLRGNEEASMQEGFDAESRFNEYIQIISDKSKYTSQSYGLFVSVNSSLVQIEKFYPCGSNRRMKMICFIERIHGIYQYLSLCIRYSEGFAGDSAEIPSFQAVFSCMNSFFKNIITNYFDIIGLLSLENLKEHLFSRITHEDDSSISDMEESNQLQKVFVALEAHMKHFHTQQRVKAKHDIVKSCNDQLISFQWFHKNYIDENVSHVKSDLFNLKKYMKTLPLKYNKFSRVSKEYEELQKLQDSIANPELRQELKKYSKAYDKRAESINSLSYVYKSVISALNAIHLNESLRNWKSEESIEMKTNLFNLLDDCHNLRKSKDKLQGVASQEIKLYSMNEPVNEIDLEWIKATSLIVSDKVKKVQSELVESNEKLCCTQSILEEAQGMFRETFAIHQRLMTDVSVLLQSLSESEDYEIPRVKSYVLTYKEFSSLVSQIAEKCVINESSVEKIIKTIAHLKSCTSVIYDELISLAEVLNDENISFYKIKKDVVLESSFQDKKGEEEKNAFAINVLRRVRSKLEGKEPDPLCQVSVPDQVDFFIKEAISVDNLSHMYEGWAPWI